MVAEISLRRLEMHYGIRKSLVYSNIRNIETKDKSLNVDSLKENSRTYFRTFQYQVFQFCEACVFSLERMKPSFSE